MNIHIYILFLFTNVYCLLVLMTHPYIMSQVIKSFTDRKYTQAKSLNLAKIKQT